MKIGYVRCSSVTQNPERQEVLMDRLGVDKVYIDMCSGKNMQRPQLQAMLDFMREGDTIIVESFSRLAKEYKRPFGNHRYYDGEGCRVHQPEGDD